MDWTALGIVLGSIILTAGGLIARVHHIHKEVVKMQKCQENHEKRLTNHDIVFENLTVNQEYMMRGIDGTGIDLKELRQDFHELQLSLTK